MRVRLTGNGQLTIDVHRLDELGSWDKKPVTSTDDQATDDRVPQPIKFDDEIDLSAKSTAEEKFVAGLLELLRRHHEQSGCALSAKVATAIMEAFSDLRERGSLSPASHRDTLFLATLLAFVDRLRDKYPARFLSRLHKNLSSFLFDKDSENDNDGNGHSNGNGHSGGETDSGSDDAEPNGDKSGGSNSEPSSE